MIKERTRAFVYLQIQKEPVTLELLEKMSDNYFCVKYVYKKSLKIPKRQSESVYRRRTDNIYKVICK
jgi:hypothetical protein